MSDKTLVGIIWCLGVLFVGKFALADDINAAFDYFKAWMLIISESEYVIKALEEQLDMGPRTPEEINLRKRITHEIMLRLKQKNPKEKMALYHIIKKKMEDLRKRSWMIEKYLATEPYSESTEQYRTVISTLMSSWKDFFESTAESRYKLFKTKKEKKKGGKKKKSGKKSKKLIKVDKATRDMTADKKAQTMKKGPGEKRGKKSNSGRKSKSTEAYRITKNLDADHVEYDSMKPMTMELVKKTAQVRYGKKAKKVKMDKKISTSNLEKLAKSVKFENPMANIEVDKKPRKPTTGFEYHDRANGEDEHEDDDEHDDDVDDDDEHSGNDEYDGGDIGDNGHNADNDKIPNDIRHDNNGDAEDDYDDAYDDNNDDKENDDDYDDEDDDDDDNDNDDDDDDEDDEDTEENLGRSNAHIRGYNGRYDDDYDDLMETRMNLEESKNLTRNSATDSIAAKNAQSEGGIKRVFDWVKGACNSVFGSVRSTIDGFKVFPSENKTTPTKKELRLEDLFHR